MLDGDETTIKTIRDEQLEMRKKKTTTDEVSDEEEDELMDDAIIERASDDEDDEEFPLGKRIVSKRKRVIDEDADDLEVESSEDEEVLDELENESFTLEEESNKRK